MSPAIQDAIDAFMRRIKREKIREPAEGQYVDRCHYSKTGWAVWNKDGACTCKPARAPRQQKQEAVTHD